MAMDLWLWLWTIGYGCGPMAVNCLLNKAQTVEWSSGHQLHRLPGGQASGSVMEHPCGIYTVVCAGDGTRDFSPRRGAPLPEFCPQAADGSNCISSVTCVEGHPTDHTT
ncbi:hypothetical protein STEG23_015133 [Scotinomys teguina]